MITVFIPWFVYQVKEYKMIITLIRRMMSITRRKEALVRLSIITSVFTGIGSIIASNIHEDYWNKTIFRVQTVDFNMLSHTLPTKLSYVIIKQNQEEIQRTLDSNYSLFGLIVTDATGKNIISYSGKNSSRPISWKAALNPEELKNHPYDVLLDPPPIFPQGVYANPRATERTATKFINKGRIIGRVYYIRIPKRTFKDDIIKWINNPFSTSGWIESYTVTIIAIVVTIILITLEHTLAREREQQLQENNRRLQIDLAEKIKGRELQQAQIDSQRSQFEQEVKHLHNEIGILNQSIAQLQSQSQNKLLELQNKLKDTQFQSQQNLNQQQEYEDRIQLLTRQLIEQKGNQSEELRQQINQAESELRSLRLREENYQQLVSNLQQQISQKDDQEQELQNQVINLQNSVDKYQKQIEESKSESERLTMIIEQYKEEVNKHDLNSFEQKIYKVLSNNFPNYTIEIQFDVEMANKEGSKFTDFILVTNRKFCVVIEAKSYTGIIKSTGTDRNSKWICETKEGKEVEILSSWGDNPYQQVKTYCDAIRRNRNLKISKRHKVFMKDTKVYGIIVFPSDSRIDRTVLDIDLYYRVITISDLVATINQLTRLS